MIFDSIELFLLKCTPLARTMFVATSVSVLLGVWWFFGMSRTLYAVRQLERAQVEHARCQQTAACAHDKAEKHRQTQQALQDKLDKRVYAAGDYKFFFKRCAECGLDAQDSTLAYSRVDGAQCAEITTCLVGSFEHWYQFLELLGTEFIVVWKKCTCKLRTTKDLEIQAEIALYTK